jgi:putative photosynthetic complex assembly protein 2
MTDHVAAALFVLALWWTSTGAILWVDGLPKSTFRFSIGGATVLALAGLFGLWWSSHLASTFAAYVAFSCALAIWAWHELSFLLGIVTGPRKLACPADARGWRRFRYATAAVIHHELALVLTLLAVAALTWGAPNQVGTWTFLVLWSMRLSAKLNVYLGVRNLTERFIPEHLRYMLSYFRKAPLNPLMPVSLLVGGAEFVHLVAQSTSNEATAFVLVGRTLVATLLGLAVLEHLFLTLPVPDALLWRWAMRTERDPFASPRRNLRGEIP